MLILQDACKLERNGTMEQKISLDKLPVPVIVALLKRAIADRWHKDYEIRGNASLFLESVTPYLFKTPSFRCPPVGATE